MGKIVKKRITTALISCTLVLTASVTNAFHGSYNSFITGAHFQAVKSENTKNIQQIEYFNNQKLSLNELAAKITIYHPFIKPVMAFENIKTGMIKIIDFAYYPQANLGLVIWQQHCETCRYNQKYLPKTTVNIGLLRYSFAAISSKVKHSKDTHLYVQVEIFIAHALMNWRKPHTLGLKQCNEFITEGFN